jgi:hypothetical protein
MIVKLFGVVDRVTSVIDGPHKSINDGAFLREFAKICADTNTSVGQKPEDFYAVVLGTFDDSTGTIVPEKDGPLRIADATDFAKEGE